MDLNFFGTQLIQPGTTNGKQGNALLGNNGLGGANGAAFWNVILGNLAETSEGSDEKNLGDLNTGAKEEVIKKEKADLALLQLALLGQDADKTLDEKLSELRIERISQSKENRIEQLTKLIDHLTNGLPAQADGENALSIEELVSRLTKRLEKLESSLEAFRSGDFGDDGAPFQALIATGLNPSQLTKITNRIEEVETKLGRELTVEDLIAGVGNIIPVPGTGDDEDEFTTADALNLIISKNNEEAGLEVESDNKKEAEADADATEISDINADAAKENIGQIISENIKNIEPREKVNFVHQQVASMLEAMQVAPSGTPFNGLNPANGNVSEEILARPLPQNLSNADFNALFKDGVNLNNSNKINFGNLKAGASEALTGTPVLPQSGALQNTLSSFESSVSHNILSDALGYDIETGTPFSNVMQAAHSISSANTQAGQTHPATSMVAAHMSKAAQKGDASNITLQLDPPELGRVEIRLEFGHEKSVKAHLIVERLETYLMLQRDAQALERALQEAGLDTDSGSLNYEMAQDDYAFNSNRDGNGSDGQSGNAANGGESTEAEEILIETTMTWDVDPETGHVHYSILA